MTFFLSFSLHQRRMLTKDCQMLLFSATFEDSVWRFAEQVVPDPNIIRLKREEETLDTIKQFYVLCKEKEDKFTALCDLYGCLTIAQAMIFCHVSHLLIHTFVIVITNGHSSFTVGPGLRHGNCTYCKAGPFCVECSPCLLGFLPGASVSPTIKNKYHRLILLSVPLTIREPFEENVPFSSSLVTKPSLYCGYFLLCSESTSLQ